MKTLKFIVPMVMFTMAIIPIASANLFDTLNTFNNIVNKGDKNKVQIKPNKDVGTWTVEGNLFKGNPNKDVGSWTVDDTLFKGNPNKDVGSWTVDDTLFKGNPNKDVGIWTINPALFKGNPNKDVGGWTIDPNLFKGNPNHNSVNCVNKSTLQIDGKNFACKNNKWLGPLGGDGVFSQGVSEKSGVIIGDNHFIGMDEAGLRTTGQESAKSVPLKFINGEWVED